MLTSAQLKRAQTYNAANAPRPLPEPVFGLDPASEYFAEEVAEFQALNGLTMDGQLGPRTAAKMTAPKASQGPWPTGLDFSGWNKDIDDEGDDLEDMLKVKAAGHSFIITKASQGTTYRYKALGRLREAAEKAGLFNGTYHYCCPAKGNAKKEAEWYVQCTGLWKPGQLPPVLDTADPKCTLKGQALIDWTLEFLARVEELGGRRAIVYSGNWYVNGWYKSFAAFKDRDLWVAAYPGKPPSPSADFPKLGGYPTKLWQFSAKHQVPGLKGGFDVNFFHGTEDELRAFCGR